MDEPLFMSPALETLGHRVTAAEAGRATVEFAPTEAHFNLAGVVHGGFIAALCDTAMGAAIRSTFEAGESYVTLSLNVQFLRAASPAGAPLVARGTVTSSSRSTITASATIEDNQGRQVAHATSTCLRRTAL